MRNRRKTDVVQGGEGHAAAPGVDRYRCCRLCPRSCGVDRTTGQTGFCGETADCRVASSCVHTGEEPSVSGTRGSGTIFFSGCSCRCFFCQNHQISLERLGTVVSPDELEQAALSLVDAGVHNLNFVTPDHFWPHVQALCRRLRQAGVSVPFLYNCSGYQQPDLVDELAAEIDIFMPDFKFADEALADTCMGDRRYPVIAMQAIRKMLMCKGALEPWEETGRVTACRGVMVRHLVLPGQVENSLSVLQLLHSAFGPELPLAVMSQFRPTAACCTRQMLDRRLAQDEYRFVCSRVEELGFERVFVQPDSGDGAFVPDFTLPEPFKGSDRIGRTD